MASSVEEWRADLIAAGWVAENSTNWRAPDGSLHRGPYGAWRKLQIQQATDRGDPWCDGCESFHQPVCENVSSLPFPKLKWDVINGAARIALGKIERGDDVVDVLAETLEAIYEAGYEAGARAKQD